ncbi:MAG: hypothetical protein CMJ59_23900 [Planctomycetaceae bacterium]|nr:hypothetical protein [Planctomycetaceae bacterium]MAV38492.1 hypothetical protein [Planctomycetaceae bacterium]
MAENKTTGGRGKKQCPKCEQYLAAALRRCECGHTFASSSKAKTKKAKFAITEEQVRVVMEIQNKLNDDPELTAEAIEEAKKPIDLNAALSSGMNNAEIKKLIKRRESQEAEGTTLAKLRKRDLEKIIAILKAG